MKTTLVRTPDWQEIRRFRALELKRDGWTHPEVDEAGFYLLLGVVRTYAPCGQTPILNCFQARDHLSVMSGVTMTGQLCTPTRDEALTSAQSIAFVLHLSRCLGRRLLVIWDGSPIHRSQQIKSFLAQGGSQLVQLESLPSYAPDLNPDEGVWQHLKHVELRNLCCDNLRHFHGELSLAIKRLRQKPHTVQSFFAGAGLAI